MGKKRKPRPPREGSADARPDPPTPLGPGADAGAWVDPIAETFGGLFSMAVPEPDLDPAEGAQRLTAVIGTLDNARRCAKRVRESLRQYLSRCLTSVSMPANRCKNCISDAMDEARKKAHACCDGKKACIEQAMYGALGAAWEIASGLGCRLPGGEADGGPPPPSPPGDDAPGLDVVEYFGGREIPSYSPILDANGNQFIRAAPAHTPGDAISAGLGSRDVFSSADALAAAQFGGGAPGRQPPTQDWSGCRPGWVYAVTSGQLWPNEEARLNREGRGYWVVEIGWRKGVGNVDEQYVRYCYDASRVPAPPPRFAPQPPPSIGVPPSPPGAPTPPKVCPTEPPCPEPQPKKWRAWYDVFSDSCYVTAPGAAPRKPNDELIWQGDSESEARQAAEKYCKVGEPREPWKPPRVNRVIGPDWCDTDVCERLSTLAGSIDQFDAHSIFKLLGPGVEEIAKGGAGVGGIGKIILSALPSLLTSLGPALIAPIFAGTEVVRSLLPCDRPEAPHLYALRVLLGFLQTFVGDAAADIKQGYDYWSRFLCPTQIPGADGARAAYLADAISIEQLECWARANNQCWEPYLTTLEAARSKPVPLELAAMRRRKWITDAEYDAGMRKLGYLDPTDRRRLFALTEQVPPMSELLRYMVRDADDAGLVAKFGMDDSFDIKFGAQLKEWAESLGISETFARYSWRAHWSIPAPGQLATFYQRFRNDPKYWRGENPREVVKNALSQQDILPYWQDAFLDASFRPITRIDGGRAFDIGAIDEAKLFNVYSQVGYDDANAQILVDARKLAKQKKAKSNRWTRLYSQGAVNRDTARARLMADGFDAAGLDEILDEALAVGRAASRLTCVRGIKKRMLAGEFARAEATVQLQKLGMDLDQADALSGGWACEVDAKGKHATASQLCRWLELGLVNAAQFVERLQKVGWSEDDAIAVLTDCIAKLDLKTSRAQEAAARKQAAAQAAADRKMKAAKAATDKQLKAIAKARAAQAKMAERREALIVDAGQTLGKKTGAGIYPAVAVARAEVARLRSVPGKSLDESIEAVVTASESFPKGAALSDFPGYVDSASAAHDEGEAEVTATG